MWLFFYQNVKTFHCAYLFTNKTVLLRDRKRRTACAPDLQKFPKCLSNFLSKILSIFCPKLCPFFLSIFCWGGYPRGCPPQLRGVPPGAPQLGGTPGGPPIFCPKFCPTFLSKSNWGVPPGAPPPSWGGTPRGAPQLGGVTPGGAPQLGGYPRGHPPPVGGYPGGAPSWGVPPGASPSWGVPPGAPPVGGYPLPPQLGGTPWGCPPIWGAPLWTDKLKTLPSRHTPYAGGNYILWNECYSHNGKTNEGLIEKCLVRNIIPNCQQVKNQENYMSLLQEKYMWEHLAVFQWIMERVLSGSQK